MARAERLEGNQNNFHKSFEVNQNDFGWHELEIGSENYFKLPPAERRARNVKADIIKFYVAPQLVILNLYGRSEQRTWRVPLVGCEGTVEANRGSTGLVNVVFRGLTRCNTFDIVKSNGESLDYNAQRLPQTGIGSVNSRGIPQGMIPYGMDGGVELRLYPAGSKLYGDRILLKFHDWE